MILQRLPAGQHNRLLGALCDDEARIFFTTVEDRAKAIPAGNYSVHKVSTPRHGVCFQVQNVEGRTGILFHVANDDTDVEGCIGVGQAFAETEPGLPCIALSRDGYKRFMRYLGRVDVFSLSVYDFLPTVISDARTR